MTALDALHRARRAWEATQPQLVIDGWADMMDGLDRASESRRRPIEPAHIPHPPLGGLAPDATGLLNGLTAYRLTAPVASLSTRPAPAADLPSHARPGPEGGHSK